jgi:hypothetical protein
LEMKQEITKEKERTAKKERKESLRKGNYQEKHELKLDCEDTKFVGDGCPRISYFCNLSSIFRVGNVHNR